MSTAATTTTSSTEQGTPAGEAQPSGEQQQQQEAQTFTQADVDRIVKDRLTQQAKNRFGDYEDLKTKAGESLTLEQRIAEMETRTQAAESAALRASVAAEFGISTKKGPKGEPSDADLFLTGSDVDTLTAQAQRLASREEDRKKQGNFAPKEGTTPKGATNTDDREFVRGLFGRAD